MDPGKLKEILIAGLFLMLGIVITLWFPLWFTEPEFNNEILPIIAFILILIIILIIKWPEKKTISSC